MLGTYAYDDLGRRTSLTRGNGLVTSYGYDAVSRLNSLGHDLSGTTSDVSFNYGHDPAGGIASMTRSNDAYAYTGHANGSTAHTADGLNRLAAIGGAGLGYDTRGNANDIPPAATLRNEETFFGYTATNALATVSSSTLYRELIADSAERLHRYYDGSANRWFLYDGAEAIAETNSTASAIARRYVSGPNGDEPLVWYEGSGTSDRRWLHADERGSVIAVSNGSGALVGSINRYDEYGTPQGTLTGRFGFTGQMWLPEVGLYHYRARAYNPAMGRFMQTDPIGYDGGMNIYAYVANDPVNFADPNGLGGCPDDPKADATVCGDPCGDEGRWWDAEPRHQVMCRVSWSPWPDYTDMPGVGAVGESDSGSPTVAQQQQACRDNPYIARALRDPDIQRQLRRAIYLSTHFGSGTDNMFIEYGFWASSDFFGGGFTPYELFTDRHSSQLSMMTRYPAEISSWSRFMRAADIAFHIHSSTRGLSIDADIPFSSSNRVVVVAVDTRGGAYCHDGR